MSSLPEWYPDPAETKPAPMPLLLVQAFVNTRDVEDQSDLFDDETAARRWLSAAGLLPPGSALQSDDLDLARAVRESLRDLLESYGADSRHNLGPLRDLANTHSPRLTIDDHGVVALENPRHDGLVDGLFGLLLIIRAAQEDGTWTRLKMCANPDCRWVFYDRSRNQHGNWCQMAVCGNRLKNRELRARRR
jgi:predicted RNA-binding Zn ribbon-like protein